MADKKSILSSLIQGGINIVGGNKAAEIAAQGQKDADAYYNKYLAEIEKLKDPELKELALQRLQQTGEFIPEVEESLLKSSAQEQIKVDDTAKKAQKEVLAQLAQRGRTGLTPEERAQRNESLRKSDASRQAGVQSVLQNLQMRGQGGGGAATLALLQAAQSGADQDSANMDRLAATSSARALQALQSRADVAGSMQEQDYGQQRDLATARDAVAKFNQDMSSRNVLRRNQAQEKNLDLRQSIADRNVGLGNEETRYNTQELPQQRFLNSTTLANMRGQAYNQFGDRITNRSQQAAQGKRDQYSGYAGIAGGITDALEEGAMTALTGGANKAFDAVGGMFKGSGQNAKMKENLDAGFAEETAAPRRKTYAL